MITSTRQRQWARLAAMACGLALTLTARAGDPGELFPNAGSYDENVASPISKPEKPTPQNPPIVDPPAPTPPTPPAPPVPVDPVPPAKENVPNIVPDNSDTNKVDPNKPPRRT